MLRASTHWLRHTNASHALNGRLGHAPVPQKYVQNILGHSSFATTSGYLRTGRDAKLQAMEGLGKRREVNARRMRVRRWREHGSRCALA